MKGPQIFYLDELDALTRGCAAGYWLLISDQSAPLGPFVCWRDANSALRRLYAERDRMREQARRANDPAYAARRKRAEQLNKIRPQQHQRATLGEVVARLRELRLATVSGQVG